MPAAILEPINAVNSRASTSEMRPISRAVYFGDMRVLPPIESDAHDTTRREELHVEPLLRHSPEEQRPPHALSVLSTMGVAT